MEDGMSAGVEKFVTVVLGKKEYYLFKNQNMKTIQPVMLYCFP